MYSGPCLGFVAILQFRTRGALRCLCEACTNEPKILLANGFGISGKRRSFPIRIMVPVDIPGYLCMSGADARNSPFHEPVAGRYLDQGIGPAAATSEPEWEVRPCG